MSPLLTSIRNVFESARFHNFPSLIFTGAGSSGGCSRGLEPPAGGCTQALDDGQGKPRMRLVLIDFGVPPLSLLLASVEMCSTSVCKSLRNLQEKRVRRGLAPQQMLFFATVRLSRPQARAAAKAAAASSSQASKPLALVGEDRVSASFFTISACHH